MDNTQRGFETTFVNQLIGSCVNKKRELQELISFEIKNFPESEFRNENIQRWTKHIEYFQNLKDKLIRFNSRIAIKKELSGDDLMLYNLFFNEDKHQIISTVRPEIEIKKETETIDEMVENSVLNLGTFCFIKPHISFCEPNLKTQIGNFTVVVPK